jgi:hypothetical protein
MDNGLIDRMRKFPPFALLTVLFCTGCGHSHEKAVDAVFIDSLISHYSPPAAERANEEQIIFWKNRIDKANPGMVSEAKYAAALVARFHATGDIRDVITADSVLWQIDSTFNHKETGPYMALMGNAILQHRFTQADSIFEKARRIGLRRGPMLSGLFDVSFELGHYDQALIALNGLKADQDFGYYFRRSKMDHLNGNIDSAIRSMAKAGALAGNSDYLKQVAFSNMADLDVHAGKAIDAGALYRGCVDRNSADFHSILGLGWIALIHDRNDSLAKRIFQFVLTQNRLPDPLFKLYQVADARGDSIAERKVAQAFVEAATNPLYGQMYNKYLIEIYTRTLNEPEKALVLAHGELENRATPQTYAWYAWTLLADHQAAAAYKVFEERVSGKPLEGLELYYMGKLMKAMDKGYNASEFFKAADKSKYDLSPGIVRDLEAELDR